jgi:hypothetical protein
VCVNCSAVPSVLFAVCCCAAGSFVLQSPTLLWCEALVKTNGRGLIISLCIRKSFNQSNAYRELLSVGL